MEAPRRSHDVDHNYHSQLNLRREFNVIGDSSDMRVTVARLLGMSDETGCVGFVLSVHEGQGKNFHP